MFVVEYDYLHRSQGFDSLLHIQNVAIKTASTHQTSLSIHRDVETKLAQSLTDVNDRCCC